MNLQEFSCLFLSIMKILMESRTAGKTIYVLSKDGHYINFRSVDFKKVMLQHIDKDGYKQYMQQLRTLEWIICHAGRFTNTQYINNKAVRVITVDAAKLEVIKKMNESEGTK